MFYASSISSKRPSPIVIVLHERTIKLESINGRNPYYNLYLKQSQNEFE